VHDAGCNNTLALQQRRDVLPQPMSDNRKMMAGKSKNSAAVDQLAFAIRTVVATAPCE
jgi:hypothetical protein